MRLNDWYEERGVFGQVTDADLSESGVCELKVQEAVVSKVHTRLRQSVPTPPPPALTPDQYNILTPWTLCSNGPEVALNWLFPYPVLPPLASQPASLHAW
jgi:hypothetical protein